MRWKELSPWIYRTSVLLFFTMALLGCASLVENNPDQIYLPTVNNVASPTVDLGLVPLEMEPSVLEVQKACAEAIGQSVNDVSVNMCMTDVVDSAGNPVWAGVVEKETIPGTAITIDVYNIVPDESGQNPYVRVGEGVVGDNGNFVFKGLGLEAAGFDASKTTVVATVGASKIYVLSGDELVNGNLMMFLSSSHSGPFQMIPESNSG